MKYYNFKKETTYSEADSCWIILFPLYYSWQNGKDSRKGLFFVIKILDSLFYALKIVPFRFSF